MDVTCTRCGTSYEFEEGLVSTTGTTVKCTHCGHLFKVYRGADTATLPDPPAELRWRVRRQDGSVHTLQSLADLTPLITAGQFRREDELSRTGQVWRRLGEVAELAPLFDGGRSRIRSDPPPFAPPPPMPSDRPRSSEPPPPPSDAMSSSRPRRPSGFEAMGSPIDLHAPPTTPIAPPPAARSPNPERPSVPLPPRAPDPTRGPLPSPRAPAAHTSPIAAQPDATDAFAQAPRPRLWLWVLVVGAVIAGAGAGISRMFVPAGAPESPVRSLLLRGDAELASHRTNRFDAAITAYTKALRFHPNDPHILSSLSRVYAVWAQLLRDEAAPPGGEAPPVDDGEAKRLAEQAKLYGDRAAQRNPGNEEASVALSDALRLTGNLVNARSELDSARATEGVPSAETLRVAALLAIDEAHGSLAAGRALAEQAVARDPTMIRARLLLARCLASTGDRAGAELHLEAVRKLDPTHPSLARVQAEMAAGTAVSATGADAATLGASGANARGGGDVAGSAEAASTSTGSASTSTSTSTNAAAAAGGSRPSSGAQSEAHGASEPAESVAELIKRGEAALERGAVPVAARAFGRALELEPGSARARVGLGFVALERGQPANAVGLFRAAASSGSSEALIGLGDAYRRLGKLRSALQTYREYVKRFPRGDRGSIARHQIELLTEQLGPGASSSGAGEP